MAIMRLPDWRSRLSDLVEEWRRQRADNCGFLIADAVLAMTGTDIAAPYRGRVTSVEQGLRLLVEDGFLDACAYLASFFLEIHPSLARAGDIMAFSNDASGWSFGIVNGERVTVLRGDGLGTLSRETAARAFQVPG